MKKLFIGLAIGACIGIGTGYWVLARFGIPTTATELRSGGLSVESAALNQPAFSKTGPPAPSAPKNGKLVSFDQTVADFGIVDQGTAVTRAFRYRNIGNQTLRILDVTSTCGCTVAQPSPREVPPGGSGLLKVTLMTGNFSGPINKTLTVRSNDPALPTAVLNLKANIRTLFIVEPRVIAFGEIERGKPALKEVLIKPATAHPIEIQRIISTYSGLIAQAMPKNDADKGGVRISFAMDSNRNFGPFNYAARVELKRPTAGSAKARPLELIVHAMGTIAGPLRVKPESVFFGSVNPGTLFRPQKLFLSSRSGKPVELRSVDTGFDGLKAGIKTVKPGLEYELELANVTAAPTGLFHRVVHIVTSESPVPIEISVAGVVMKPTTTAQ